VLCASCGRENASDARFCAGCGRRLRPVLASSHRETAWTRALAAILDGRLAAASRECAGAHERHYASILTMRAVERREMVEPAQVDEAVEFFRSVGATRYLARIEPGADPVLVDTG
jgi:hypothetical protein